MKQLPRYLRITAACLLAVFAVQFTAEIVTYNGALTAVPLWMRLAIDALLFLLPAAVLFALSVLLRKKHRRGG